MNPNSDLFDVPGSPLHHRPVPRDWKSLDPNGKRRRLMAIGLAASWDEACKKLGAHAAAVKALRKERERMKEAKRRGEGSAD